MAFSRSSRVALASSDFHATVSLTLLGNASVEGPAGLVTGRGARGPRLALLAVLASARGRPVTRDKLVGLLWPDASDERARPLLSDALYLVRGALGEEAILTTGDELWLNRERVQSDVEQFGQLFADKAYDEAVALYAGPFLDGFHLADASEFSHWLDGERARLAVCYAESLAAIAAVHELERDWSAAVIWLRRLAAQEPYSAHIAMRLMRALHESGNRAAALQHARVHGMLIHEEFGTAPDPAVEALVASLRADPVPYALPEVPSQPTAHEPVVESTTSPTIQVAAPAENARDPREAGDSGDWRDARDADDAHAPRFRSFDRQLVATLLGLLIVAGAALGYRHGDGPDALAAAIPDRASAHAPTRSIAVLPFDDLGADHAETWFSDGLTEEIIGLLGRVDGLSVAARSSSFALRNTHLEARSLGDTLRVATLLEGSVRRAGDRIRVTARLIDVASGYQLWSRSYDRRPAEIIPLQNEIAGAIVDALQLRLGSAVANVPSTVSPNSAVHDLYLRGIFARNKFTRDGLLQALAYFDRAIALDSTYAPAHAARATTIGPLVWYGHLSYAIGAPMMHSAVRRALVLDEHSSEAHVALGMAAVYFDWQAEVGAREFRRAIELNPNDAQAHHFLANVLKSQGRFAEMIASRLRALELDPLSVRTGMLLGADYLIAGRYDRAAEEFRRASELDSGAPSVLGGGPGIPIGLGQVYELENLPGRAIAEYLRIDSIGGVSPAMVAELRAAYTIAGLRGYWRVRATQMEQNPQVRGDPFHLAWMWQRAGDTERAVLSIERAYREHNLGLIFLGVLPELAVTRQDPRVKAILEKMR